MADQTSSQRDDAGVEIDDDPLAELARIISGESSDSGNKRRAEENSAGKADTAADDGFDLEAELMQEIGSDETNEPVDAKSSSTDDQNPSQDADFSDDVDQEALSVEEQLMAELAGDEEDLDDFETGRVDYLEADESFEEADDRVGASESENVQRAPEPAAGSTQANIASVDDIVNRLRDSLQGREGVEDANDRQTQVKSDPGSRALENAPATTVDADENLDAFLEEGFEAELGDEFSDEDFAQSTGGYDEDEAVVPPPTFADDPDWDFGDAFEAELSETQPSENHYSANTAESDHSTVENAAADSGRGNDDFADFFAGELELADLDERDPGPPPIKGSAYQDQSQPAGAELRTSQENLFGDMQETAYQSQNSPELDPGHLESGLETDENQTVPPAPQNRKGFRMALAALGAALLLGLGVVGWGAWNEAGTPSVAETEPPLIKADEEPVRVKPDDPGGKEIANQDNQVYDRAAGNAEAEPAQEELITARQDPQPVDTKADTRLSPAQQPGAEANGQLGLSPKRVRTLTVLPDGTIVRTDEAASAETQPSEPVTPQISSDALVPPTDLASNLDNSLATEPEAPEETDGSTVSIDGAVSTGAIPIPVPNPAIDRTAQSSPPEQAEAQTTASEPQETIEVASAEPAAPVVTSSEWKMQISSQRSRDAAEASYNNLRQRFSSILGDRVANIESADIEGKGRFYQVKVVTQSRQDAINLCERLKQAGGSCFVTR